MVKEIRDIEIGSEGLIHTNYLYMIHGANPSSETTLLNP